MKTRILLVTAAVMLAGAYPVKANLVFDSGHNIFDDNEPYWDEVWVIDEAILDVLGGAMGKLELTDHATANIYDGDIDSLFIQSNSVVNIHGGTFDMFAVGNDSLAYLYAYDVTHHITDGLENEGWIEGIYYSNHSPFSFSFYNDVSYSHVNIVPEPACILLFGFGALLLRRRK